MSTGSQAHVQELFISFGLLKLRSQRYACAIILIIMMFACQGNRETPVRKDRQATKKETKALSIIRNDDCMGCHSIEDEAAAPPYLKIARRYDADEMTINRLADKIIAGGGGVWAGGIMTEHPFLKKPDALKIVRWILSLDDSSANRDPMLYTDGIKLADSFEQPMQENPKQNGLMLKVYSLKSLRDHNTRFPNIPQEAVPMHSGVVEKIHLPGPESFHPLTEDFLLQATGFIHIKTKGEYFFKQVRTGKGRVFVNGETKINENDWDSETLIDLSPGVYPIRIDYQSSQGGDQLSLQWITPEEEYYQVIPTEVFTYK